MVPVGLVQLVVELQPLDKWEQGTPGRVARRSVEERTGRQEQVVAVLRSLAVDTLVVVVELVSAVVVGCCKLQ